MKFHDPQKALIEALAYAETADYAAAAYAEESRLNRETAELLNAVSVDVGLAAMDFGASIEQASETLL